ncbi:hypothetical protein [Streptomyces sp. NPDC047028]|uniref:hypothetical protein n=1 Tax=Streptomyces sp. NPDC047028 TaxID=3155793 RepID=UPI0033C7E87A
MFEFELHEMRSAELRRAAREESLAREAVRSRRAARRAEAAGRDGTHAESQGDTDRPRRLRLPRTA